MTSMARFAVFALLLGGCGTSGDGIQLTLITDSSISDTVLASITELDVGASNALVFNQKIPLPAGRGLLRTERVLFQPRASSGSVSLGFYGYDSNGALLICNSGDNIDLATVHSYTVSLHACPSGGPDLSTPEDLTGADLSATTDGAQDLQPPDGGVICPTSAIVCDDFENGLGQWTADPGITIDTTVHHHGSHSARVQVSGPASGQMYEQAFFGINQTITYPLYVRAWLYFSGPAASAANGALINVESSLTSGVVILGYGGGVWGLGSQNLGPGEYAPQPSSTVMLNMGQWTCVEWMVNPAPPGQDGGGAERVSINLTDDPTLHVDSIQLATASSVYMGWQGLMTSGQTFDVWYDEVAIAHEPMGCP
jgi:hypothetical protein